MITKPRKFFLCTGIAVEYKDLYKHPGAHIIGHLQYLTDEGRKITALARWEKSVTTQEVPPLLPEIDVYLIGDARQIKCRFPGCIRRERWEIGKAAFLVLMSRYQEVVSDGREKVS
jgi:hypothetical protein